jgi:hypothetical protein
LSFLGTRSDIFIISSTISFEETDLLVVLKCGEDFLKEIVFLPFFSMMLIEF